MRLGYIYSRYPVLSQTFCDAEMLELERRGHEIVLASLYPPKTELRHEYLAKLRAKIQYAPDSGALDKLARKAKRSGRWPAAMVQEHDLKYGAEYKAALRARNALFFVELFERERIPHFHVHFANRAAHTALFVKAISGIPFSITAHGQDFMTDLGNEGLLRELCAAAAEICLLFAVPRLLGKSFASTMASISVDFRRAEVIQHRPVQFGCLASVVSLPSKDFST